MNLRRLFEITAPVTLMLAFNSLAAGQGGNDAAASTPFAGVSLRVLDSTVPPGGILQFQLKLTEPKPIGNSSTRPTPRVAVRGISLNDQVGQTVGVAVFDDTGVQISAVSPAATFGTDPNSDYPIITVDVPVGQGTTVGSQFMLTIDEASSFWTDAAGAPYPQEIKAGTLTIGGTTSITRVVPGGGVQPAGTRISIFGMGFSPTSKVDFSGVILSSADFKVVSPNQIDVILPAAKAMDGTRVRVKNGKAVVTYFSYLRTEALGQSSHPLVNQVYPLFARAAQFSGTLGWRRNGTIFTGLAVQNPSSTTAQVNVQVTSATNALLGSLSFTLPPMSKITRDLQDLFAQPPAGATSVHVTSTAPIQMLGLLGDDTAGTVVPIFMPPL